MSLDSSSAASKAPAIAHPQDDANSRHFDVSHLKQNLNNRIAKSGAITLSSQMAVFGLRMISTAILARLLTPADFGLIAMITVVTGFLEMFKDAGLSMATIQREKITHAQVSTLFWINVALGMGVMLIQAALAPAIAWFYGEPKLIPVTLALACLVVFSGMAVQHQALLRRNMRFGRLAVIEIASMAIGVVIAVLMARAGFRYWSLVGMTAGTTISASVLSFVLSRWIPGLPSRKSGVRPMLRFGGNLVGANFFNYLTTRADTFIIGVTQGPTALGIYGRAYALFLAPVQQFLPPISAVVIPALSRAVSDPQKFRNICLEKSYFVIFFTTLTTGFSFAAAPELVRLLLGPGWEQAATVVRCLAIGGAISGTNIAGGWVSATHGWTHRQLKVAMIAGPSYTVAFLIGSKFGIVGVACAYSATCLILRYPTLKYVLKGSPIQPNDIIRPLISIGCVAALAVFGALCASWQFDNLGSVALLTLEAFTFLLIVILFWFGRLIKLPKVSWNG